MEEVIKKWECSICGSIIMSFKRPSKCQCGSSDLRILMVEGNLPVDELRKIHDKEVALERGFELIWEKDLMGYELEDKEWIIQDLIPSRSVGVWTGKRGSLKTFVVLNAVACICSEKPFLNRFATTKGKVIYLDKENGVLIMKQRVPLIKKGLNLTEDLDLGFICFSNLKIDKMQDLGKIEELIKEHKPILLVVDTYRRGISFEENDAGAVSKLFVDQLRPLVEKYGLTILLIHHDRKGESQGDEMDMIRGSSDLANYADFILKNERKGEKLIIKQLKMRSAPEHKDIEVIIESNHDTSISFKSEKDYEVMTKEKKCAEVITMWIYKNQLTTFKVSEAKEEAFRAGVKKNNFFNGLELLENTGLIEKIERGEYKVSKDLKLIV